MNPSVVDPCLVPVPVLVKDCPGVFRLLPETEVVAPEELKGEARRVQAQLRNASGFDLPSGLPSEPASHASAIELRLDRALGDEEYRLSVTPGRVVVTGGGAPGIQHGCATLLRLFPPQVFRLAAVGEDPWVLPCMEIEDRPAFAWRALMVDVARHFMPKRELFRIIELMALLQFNVMHLHLTDDQGWRVEIDGYPRLTEVATWRKESQVGPSWSEEFDGRPHGGFYTQQDLRELVAYAAERHVSIMPEVDLPGHMEAAIAAYPNFGTSREKTEVRTKWGVSTNVLNLDPTTIGFVMEVVRQLADIFPFEFFSIGGDECPTQGWAADPGTQARKAELGIDSDRGVQAWYTKHVADYLRERGRRIVAWDEVLEEELDDDVVILSWRGMRGAEVGLARGLDVISCPTSYCYFDYRQSESSEEPVPVGVAVTLERVYSFDPVPKGKFLEDGPGRVLGGQGNLWAEFMNTSRSFDFAAFPRAAALAEVLWSGPGRDFKDFERRLPGLLARFDVLGVEYRPLDGPHPWQKRPGVPGDFSDFLEHETHLLQATSNLKVTVER